MSQLCQSLIILVIFDFTDVILLYILSANAYRLSESQAELPTIPVHAIGYEDAYPFLRCCVQVSAYSDHRF